MIPLLVTITVVEVALLVVVLAVYLVKIAASLRATIGNLAKIGFGVRAIETQSQALEPSLSKINAQLEAVAGDLERLEQVAGQRDAGR